MRDRLVFYINGQRHEVRGDAAGATLSDYLRLGLGGPRQSGTKIACAEGDCGACTVLVGKPRFPTGGFDYQTVDACIAFVYQFDRHHIVTVEGLALDGELTQVQSAMVDCHGSQCGFCTPGFVMALAGLAEEAEGELTDDELRLGLSGNLCRCTGYSQILDAGRRCGGAGRARVVDRFDTHKILTELVAVGDEGVHVNRLSSRPEQNGAGRHPPEIVLPTSIDQLLAARAANTDAKLVSGATDIGVQFNHGRIDPPAVIATAGVAELQEMRVENSNEGRELVIGAGVTWSQIEDFSRDAIPEYHAILTRFGSPQVRHVGTLVGNLANASPIADSIPFHYVAESTIELASLRGSRQIAIDQFYLGYKKLDMAADEAILRVRTPLPTDATQLKLYKVSKRRDMDISTVTLAFWIERDGDTIAECRMAAGGVGPTVVRLPLAEQALVGQPLSLDAMRAAGRIARGEVTPITDVRGSAEFRGQLIENLFAKYWHDLTPEPQGVG